MHRALLLCTALLLVACRGEPSGTGDSEEPPASALTAGDVLGGEADTGFLRAVEPRQFRFPDDHGPHPGFRNEWWYVTGNLDAADGRRFGYQLTFFLFALPASTADSLDSAWTSDRIWMAHLALTDVENGRHYAVERFSRENPGLAGAALNPFRVWLQSWQMSGGSGDSLFPWQLQAGDEAFGLDLQLDSGKPPVLQGDAGLSRKSATPGNASYYYSLPRMPTRGRIRLGDSIIDVTGASWLDREWSTSVLEDDQSGWDWFSLQFNDGRELMYYQLRTQNGDVHPFSAGNLTDGEAVQHPITPQDISLTELDTWTASNGTEYTTAWHMAYAGNDWRIEAVLDDQWMDLSVAYWEGAVDVIDQASGEPVGRGYLEMVR